MDYVAISVASKRSVYIYVCVVLYRSGSIVKQFPMEKNGLILWRSVAEVRVNEE